MYSSTIYLSFAVVVTVLLSLFSHMGRAFPASDEDARSLTFVTTESGNKDDSKAKDETLIYSTGQMQYDQSIEVDLEDRQQGEIHQPKLQKCRRNKRHIHRQNRPDQDGTHIVTESKDLPEKIPRPNESSTSPLTDTDIVEIEMQYHIERIKRKILDKLRLDQPPRVTAPRPQLPPELSGKVQPADDVQMINSQDEAPTDGENADDDVDDDSYGKTTQIIILAENGTDKCDFPDSSLCYQFSAPSSTVSDAEITSASMWVYVVPDPSNNSSTWERTLILAKPAKHYGQRSILKTQQIDISKGWVEIKIQHGLHKWSKHQQYVEVSFAQGLPTLSKLPSQQPKLSLDVTSHSRVSRSIHRRRVCHATTRQCCMQQFTINFAEIGWDFVIEPTEYVANYCKGQCTSLGPFTYDHSQVISLKAHQMRSQPRGRSAVATAIEDDLMPCCAPEQLEPLSIMYLNEDNQITVDILPDMTVTSCGCA